MTNDQEWFCLIVGAFLAWSAIDTLDTWIRIRRR